jgi:hypothetical protein
MDDNLIRVEMLASLNVTKLGSRRACTIAKLSTVHKMQILLGSAARCEMRNHVNKA